MWVGVDIGLALIKFWGSDTKSGSSKAISPVSVKSTINPTVSFSVKNG